MQFFQLKNPDDGSISTGRIMMIDDQGQESTVFQGNRLWDVYQEWLSGGNTPQPAK